MGSKYLTTTKEYNKRLAICRACEFYFKPTGTCKKCGCFMRIKAKLSTLSCPIDKWRRTTIYEEHGKISPEIIKEIKDIWPDIKNKRAKDHKVKGRLIALHNLIYATNFKPTSNCGACLNTAYNGIARIYKDHIETKKPKKNDCNC